VTTWYERELLPGTAWNQEIDKHLTTSDIVLLLVSPNFMNSDYCYSIEMQKALERHEQGEARVIPVILRPVNWQEMPFGKLQAYLPMRNQLSDGMIVMKPFKR
jgi:internalin A